MCFWKTGTQSNDPSNPTTHNTDPSASETNDTQPSPTIPKAITIRLYLSHFLSTWNSRSFEFGAVLFLAAIFRSTLLPLSIYALIRSASAIVFAPVVGKAVDSKGRLAVLRFSIVAGRLAVILSCLGLWCLLVGKDLTATARWAVFGLATALACIEKPCSVMNQVAVERDWVVVIAGDNGGSLQKLNARMRRIDLFCKLCGPLFIALIDGVSTRAAIFLTLGLNVLSVPIEFITISQVYTETPNLQQPRSPSPTATDPPDSLPSNANIPRCLQPLIHPLKIYFTSPALLPSLSLSLLYLTVLSFSGQMITFLSTTFSSPTIGGLRTVSTVFELSATWLAPRLMACIHPARAGAWFLNWQLLSLIPGVVVFWTLSGGRGGGEGKVRAGALVVSTILSRVGLWGFDLCAQFLIQETIPASSRGAFSSTEASLQNLFELLSYILTIVWSKPESFKFPVIVSLGAAISAAALFSRYLKIERGHLIHRPQCVKC